MCYNVSIVKKGKMMETVDTVGSKTETSASKSRKELTSEEKDFYKLIRLRATASNVGQPYIASAIFRLTPISAPGLKTMGVDKFWRCYIDFDFMIEKGVEFAAGVLAHEPWHLLRDHDKRAENAGAKNSKYPPLMWNIAGDLEINDDIVSLVPQDSLFPGQGEFVDYPEGELAEVYFEKLKEDIKCSQCSKPMFGAGGSSDPSNGDEGSPSNDGSEDSGGGETGEDSSSGGNSDGESSEATSGSSDGDGEACSCPGKVTVSCGSGSGNELEGYELSEGEAEAVDAEEHESIKTMVAEELKKYERSNPGSVPNNAKLWAETVLAHKPVSWKQVLRGEVKQAIAWKRGKTDYQKKRPSRRQPVKDVFFPALRSPNPKIGVAVDTSASNVHNLGVVLKEIEAIIKQVGVRGRDLLVFSVDTNSKGNLQPVSDVSKIEFAGGGGTDMRVAYRELADINPSVDIGIVITDGETPWLDSSPKNGLKFITVIISDSGDSYSERVKVEAENSLSKWSKLIFVDSAEPV